MAVEAGPSKEDMSEDTGGRGRTFRFILVFVVVVLFLLTGYRYAINTRLNDWYLFQVARHTSWVLGKAGHSSELESALRAGPSPREARASLNAWKQGREAPTAEEVAAASNAPLTPWERWSYRAYQTRQATHGGLHGPHVSFVLRPGITQQLRQAQAQLEILETDNALSAGERAAKRAELQKEIEALRARHREFMERRGEGIHPERGKFFDFYVVSECGAIEVMAIFLAAVLAFPTRWWKRLVGLILGLPVMYAVNIFRLSCLGVIGALTAGGKIFHFSHYYVWQAIYIIFVVVVWLAWLEFLVNRERRMPPFFRTVFASRARIRRVAMFGVRFAAGIVVCAVLWWWFVPVYGRALLAICMWILRWTTSLPIDGGRIEAHGLLNTETRLIFEMAGREPALPIALLVTNIPPYIALVLATAGLRLWRRLRILAYGCGILVAGHIVFIVVVLRYQEALQKASEVPTAIIQFFLTLPFLLWIVFAYWGQMMRYLASQEGRSGGQPPDSSGGQPPDSSGGQPPDSSGGQPGSTPGGPPHGVADPSLPSGAAPDETARRMPVSPTCVLPGEPIDFQENSGKSGEKKMELRERIDKCLQEMRNHLFNELLPFWTTHGVDEQYGGFLTYLDKNGNPTGETLKTLVCQTRMIYTYSSACRAQVADACFLEIARQGVDFLIKHFWDQTNTGWYWTCRQDGTPQDRSKIMYGHSFAIYALSEFAMASGDRRALEMAEETWRCIRVHAADILNGGFGEFFEEDWSPKQPGVYGGDRKSLDVHMHLMEAFTNLYEATGEARHRRDACDVIDLLFRHMIHPEYGTGIAQFSFDWTPLRAIIFKNVWGSDRDVEDQEGRPLNNTSYGHNVEFAWLLNHSIRILDLELERYKESMRKIFDHCAKYGIDWERGGVYCEGAHDGPARERNKEFWQQAEALIGFLDACLLFGPEKYFDAYENVHRFVMDYVINHAVGEWYPLFDENNNLLWDYMGHAWKINYHTVRAAIQSENRLARLLAQTP